MSNNLEKWDELKRLVESLEIDVHKNARGNASAGIRTRKGLRLLRSKTTELVKSLLEADKERKKD